jgi:hypothetical protein
MLQVLKLKGLTMTEPRKSAGNTRGKPFEPGNSGKPKGARHKITRAIEELMEGEHEALTRVALDKAKGGDMIALRLCMERLCPVRRDSHVSFALPAVASAGDAVGASSSVITAVAAGDITPDEGARVMLLLTAHKAIVETGDLEARIAALEARTK